MQYVVPIVVALFTWLGSAAMAERYRRRDAGAAVQVSLDVWERLPDSDAREKLLRRIQRRVDDLAHPRPQPLIYQYEWLAPAIGGGTALLIGELVQTFGGSHTWKRHADGILWMDRSDGTYTTFTHWLAYTLLGMPAAFCLLLYVVGPFAFDKAIPWCAAELGQQWRKIRGPKPRSESSDTRPFAGDVSRTVIDG